jgi:hypothetical protein
MRHALLATTILLAACGGESGPSGDADGHFTALVGGEEFSSDPAYVNLGVNVTAQAPGIYVISGGHVEGTSSEAINISLYNVRGPGTYAIGVGPTVDGASAVIVDDGKGWGTDLSGDAGTVTITQLSATRIKGTFSFVAQAVSGGATGTREVTNGDFDLAVKSSGSLPTVPEEKGGFARGSVDGAWNASTAIALTTSTTLGLTASNTAHTVSVSIGAFTGEGTYSLSQTNPIRIVQVQGPANDPAGSDCCWGGTTGTGTITITSATSKRVTGTITATLPASGGTATSDLAVDLEFDMGLPQF